MKHRVIGSSAAIEEFCFIFAFCWWLRMRLGDFDSFYTAAKIPVYQRSTLVQLIQNQPLDR
jgi:hypothetical protein